MESESRVEWQAAPFFGVRAPEAPPGIIGRPAVTALLNELSQSTRVVQVVAPAGFGKTTALSEWSRQHQGVIGWITATAELQNGQRMFDAVIASLQAATEHRAGGPVRAIHSLERSIDNPSNWRALLEALATDRDRTVLVIDDAHLIADAFDHGVLAELTREGSALLRLVVGSRTSIPAFTRGEVSGAAATVTSAALAFSLVETSLASAQLDRPMSSAQLEAVHASTRGWPAGVRLSLLSRPTAPTRGGLEALPGGLGPLVSVDDTRRDLLIDYLEHETLDQLPESFREFIMAATTYDEVTAEWAEQVTGRRDAAAQLELAVEKGLFVERLTGVDGRATYRWHQMFAAGCRAILSRTHPQERARLNRVAACTLREAMPLRAVSHALEAADPELAQEILASSWLNLLIQGDAAALEELCALLPGSMQRDVTTLVIRACARDMQGDRLGARMLLREASSDGNIAAAQDPAGPDEVAFVLAQLMVEDDHATLMAACDRAADILSGTHGLSPGDRNAALFLLGWTELRLRRDARRSIALLTAADQAAQIVGDHVLSYRARSNAGFARAFAGDFVGAHEALQQARPAWDADAWTSYDGGIESFTAGYVAYWQDDLVSARHHLDDVLQYGGDASYAALARIFIAHVASGSGDPRAIEEAELGLRKVTASMAHGLPWDTYVVGARARLAAARGDLPRAVELANSVPDYAFVPTVTVDMAAIHLREGNLGSVLRLLQRLSPLSAQPVYVRVSALLLNALVQSRRGQKDSAHGLVESALVLAAPQDVCRPFRENHVGLRRLLLAHADHGTHHERWLAARIAAIDLPPDGSPASRLSKREREVLSYLRGTMTNAEIADALYVSVNTLKTHQRIIYRKLGVTSRREAVSLTRQDGDD